MLTTNRVAEGLRRTLKLCLLLITPRKLTPKEPTKKATLDLSDMSTRGTKIQSMNDVSWKFYKNLQADEAALSKVISAIKHKSNLIETYNEMWLDYEKLEIDEADAVYNQKFKLEMELATLVKEKKAIEKRITSYACKKTRGA